MWVWKGRIRWTRVAPGPVDLRPYGESKVHTVEGKDFVSLLILGRKSLDDHSPNSFVCLGQYVLHNIPQLYIELKDPVTIMSKIKLLRDYLLT